MIIFENKEFNYKVEFEGSLETVPTKIGSNETTTIYGRRVSEVTRFVFDIDVTINYLRELDYKNLAIMFGMAHDVNIKDSETGEYYTGYYIFGDTLVLEKKEDYKNKEFYRSGSLRLNKR